MTCGECKHFYAEQQPGGEVTVCRHSPPTAFLTRVHRDEATGAITGMENSSVFPFVRRDWACGQFARRLALVNGPDSKGAA